ncbi:hypothetical protein GWK47_021813 [Chionoecetes opilio]|uniref:Uncharacterized protein n=1 Tax=Chionoecetes opilio TaxID=41210 RepID=A0A8J4XR75_CHIOP|nr:hypothetical protein GWK47_021813 [Chionoecetes opilio]
MPFDTTASNPGPAETGPVSSSEQKMGKTCCISPVVYHILELVVHAVFVRVLGCSSSPEHLLFKRFQTSWEGHRPREIGTGIMVEEVATVLEDVKDEALRWTLQVLQSVRTFAILPGIGQTCHHFPRWCPSGGIRFLAPGAMHQARWMSKVLYSFKIWMFQGQFRLTKKEERGLQRFASLSPSLRKGLD